jgi:hypothetical protein
LGLVRPQRQWAVARLAVITLGLELDKFRDEMLEK